VIYSDAELMALLGDLESDLVERKQSFRGDVPAKAREAVCAFANDLPDHRTAGVLFIGAYDNGTPAGEPITDDLLKQLADMRTDGNIVPPPSLTVEKRSLLGADIAVVTVQPSDSPPVRYKGRICIRTGPRRDVASQQDERILTEKRRYKNLPFDVHPFPPARIEDLNRLIFELNYLPNAVDADTLAANGRSYLERLASLKMISSVDDPVPTVLGLLTLGGRTLDFLPGAYIQFLQIDGDGLSDPIVDEQKIVGTVSDVIDGVERKLESHNRVSVDFTSATHERRLARYPLPAVQQLVRNAVMHRTYEGTHAPIRVYWFKDRLEILSPGGPFGGVTAENFGKPGVTDYRNPNLAEALKTLGYVQKFGAGIETARRELKANGNPPLEFEISSSMIVLRLRV
jgi:ATP-dependent DNA helicase RecG